MGKIGKIDFSFDSIHCASLIKMGAKLLEDGEGLHILNLGKRQNINSDLLHTYFYLTDNRSDDLEINNFYL